jgi:type VI secretion system protein ImpB
MAQEGSVAPKERVNIVYKPATGDAKEDVELPLKLLVVGDFTLKPDSTPLEDRKPIAINKDNFDEVLRARELSLDLAVPNMLDKDAKPDDRLTVQLRFESLKDFEPDALVDKVPELRQLIELRSALKALKGPLGNLPEFRRRIQEAVKDEGTRQKLLDELGIKQ